MEYKQGNLFGDSSSKFSGHFDIPSAWREFPRKVSQQ